MTPSLQTQIAQLAEFDELGTEDAAVLTGREACDFTWPKPGVMKIGTEKFRLGAQAENARLKPLILALGECVCALEKMHTKHTLRCTNGFRGQGGCVAECTERKRIESLQKLSEVLAGMK